MINLLFICSGAIDRSPCAESLFKNNLKYKAKSAGVGPLTENPVTKEMINWADIIFCMETEHRNLLFDQIPESKNKEIKILNIPNNFLRYDLELEKLLKIKLNEILSI